MPLLLDPPISSERPVTWAQAKAHLRLDTDDQQAYVESLIDAAVDYAQTRLHSTLLATTLTQAFYENESLLILPRGPVISVTSVTDANGAALEYTQSRVGSSDRLTLTSSTGAAPVTVVYQAGYPTAADIPKSIIHAILCHVGTLFENRESASDKNKMPVPHSLDAFYRLKSRFAGVG
jgi:uncharacterized phiE125 gp8 family phage protein